MNTEPSGESRPPVHADGTVRLPDAIEEWLDGHFAGDMGDDARELEGWRNVTAVAFWSLIYRTGEPTTDQAALDVFVAAAESGSNAPQIPKGKT